MGTARDEIEKILASSEDDTQVLSALYRFGERWEVSNTLEDEVALIERRFPQPMLAVASRWMERVFSGEDDPRLRLCDRFIVTGPYAYKIRGKKFGDEHIENLCRSEFLGGIRYFTTTVSHKFGPRTFIAFANAKTLCNLREIDLSHTKPGKSGMAALGAAPSLSKLETLRLINASIDGKQLDVFCKGTALPSLRSLVLSRNPIGALGASALASSPMARSLESLDLHECALDLDALTLLTKSPQLTRLKQLKLDYNEGLRGAVCEALAEASFAPSLVSVDLSYVPISADGLAKLAKSAPMLSEMVLRKTGLSSVDPLLVARDTPPRALWLDDCPIDAAQLRELLAAPWFSSLTELGVAGTLIGSDGILALSEANLSSLTALNASGPNITRAAWEKLVANPTLQPLVRDTLARMLAYITA